MVAVWSNFQTEARLFIDMGESSVYVRLAPLKDLRKIFIDFQKTLYVV